MAMTNFVDISTPPGEVGAGFQFEFTCASCGETWKSPFVPYRQGQAAGLFRKFGYLVSEFYKIGALTNVVYKLGMASGSTVEMRSSKAKQEALAGAQAMAEQRYEKCGSCRGLVCANCFNESTGICIKCEAATGGATAQGGSSSSAACPNCQVSSQGGRFCHECGFDMASTHKSCPSCGVTMSRQARFCTDCGHGF